MTVTTGVLWVALPSRPDPVERTATTRTSSIFDAGARTTGTLTTPPRACGRLMRRARARAVVGATPRRRATWPVRATPRSTQQAVTTDTALDLAANWAPVPNGRV